MLSNISANKTAPHSSSLGMDKVLIGATFVLEEIKCVEMDLPSSIRI